MIQVRKYFEAITPLTDEEWKDLEGRLKQKKVSKRTMLLEVGNKCNFVAIILSGSFRFLYTKEGEEKVTAFFFAGDFLSNYRSFLTDTPSDHAIEALQDGEVVKLYKRDLVELFGKYKAFERIGRLVAERVYLTVSKRLDSFLFETPEERYADLLKRNSRLLQDIPQYMLASYLGIQPESLSRIRKRKV